MNSYLGKDHWMFGAYHLDKRYKLSYKYSQ